MLTKGDSSMTKICNSLGTDRREVAYVERKILEKKSFQWIKKGCPHKIRTSEKEKVRDLFTTKPTQPQPLKYYLRKFNEKWRKDEENVKEGAFRRRLWGFGISHHKWTMKPARYLDDWTMCEERREHIKKLMGWWRKGRTVWWIDEIIFCSGDRNVYGWADKKIRGTMAVGEDIGYPIAVIAAMSSTNEYVY
jgi:hypothetical protein